ncbi:MAG: MBL fold metallo-hydrolase [Chloroflexi bacterium]|nr:MBL fold metallo-hydrolase [Chloroflexota bacterium]
MKLTNDVHVVGSGRLGFGISGALDCHVYLINGGNELALIDTGMGLPGDFEQILANIRDDGLDPKRIRKIILTHYHCDHIGAAQEAYQRLDAEVIASRIAAPAIRSGEERAVALDVAKAAGFYPLDYHLPPCPVTREVSEGDRITVGDYTLNVWDTPGHSDGHLSFTMQGSDRTYLIGADLVFWGGKIVLQNIHDCRIDAYAKSVLKMAALDFDALLPGHLQISLSGGKAHVEQAAAAFKQLGVPPNLL